MQPHLWCWNILLILLPSSLRLNWNGRTDKTDIGQPSVSQPTWSGTGDKQGALQISLIESWVSTYCHVEVYTGGIDIKTNGGGIQPCRQHSNGARKQEEDTERCHQQADCHSKTYVEFPAKYHQGHSHSWFVTLVTSTCSPAPAESQATRGIPENRTICQLPNHSRSRRESHTVACWIRAEITGDPQQLGTQKSPPTQKAVQHLLPKMLWTLNLLQVRAQTAKPPEDWCFPLHTEQTFKTWEKGFI